MPKNSKSDAVEGSRGSSLSQDSSMHAYQSKGKPFGLYSSIPYYFLLILYVMGYVCIAYYKNPYWVIGLVFLGIPVADYFSHDWLNPTPEQYKELENSVWFKIPLLTLTFVDTVFVFWLVSYLSENSFPWVFYPGAIYIGGAVTGSNFLIAHELFHKRGKLNQILGSLTMAKNLYMHFYIEHNFGHHKNVATPLDPASSRYGESLFQYLPRTIIGSYKSAWNIENRRLMKLRGHKTPWVIQNKMIWFTLNNFVFPLAVLLKFGVKGLIIYLSIVVISVVTLETINYIEHYALERKRIGPNEYERVTIMHSWNAPQRFSNYLLFKLQRHSDHHENAYKPYHVLLTKDESPMLPHGYTLCLILANFPKVWFRMMDRSLAAYKEKRELTREERRQNDIESWIIFLLLAVIFGILCVINIYSNN